MIKYLSSIFIAVSVFSAQAQLKLIDPTHPGGDLNNTTINISGTPADNDLEFSMSVINTSAQPMTIKCRRTEVDVLAGTTNTTCWVLCPPYINAGDIPMMVIGQNGVEYAENIPAGDTAIGFLAHYGPHNIDGCSLFLYEFFDETDPNTALGKVYGRFTHNVTTSCTASLRDDNDFNFSMYPNPANEQLNFKVDEANLSVQVLDLLGKTVVEKRPLVSSQSLDLHELKNGVYFVSILKRGVVLKTEKLIIKH